MQPQQKTQAAPRQSHPAQAGSVVEVRKLFIPVRVREDPNEFDQTIGAVCLGHDDMSTHARFTKGVMYFNHASSLSNLPHRVTYNMPIRSDDPTDGRTDDVVPWYKLN